MAEPNLTINRNQLSSFIRDPETLRRFEALFSQAGTITPEQIIQVIGFIQDSDVSSGTYGNGAEVAQAKSQYDYLDFDQYQAAPFKTGRLSWSGSSQTLTLDMVGMRQNIGQEVFERVINNSGAGFTAGTVVGVSPTTGQMVRFIADGSIPAQNIIGVAAQGIALNAAGMVALLGDVSGLNTSAWAVGDILYASDLSPGGLTKNRPVAPSLVIPVARVIVSAAGQNGKIAVRPVVFPTRSYGGFIKSDAQAPSAINTPTAALWTASTIASGMGIGTPTSRVVASVPGAYRVASSMRLQSTGVAVANAWGWLRKNGADISDSASLISIDPGATVSISMQAVVTLDPGDYLELMFAADAGTVALAPGAAPAFAPATPSANLTATLES